MTGKKTDSSKHDISNTKQEISNGLDHIQPGDIEKQIANALKLYVKADPGDLILIRHGMGTNLGFADEIRADGMDLRYNMFWESGIVPAVKNTLDALFIKKKINPSNPEEYNHTTGYTCIDNVSSNEAFNTAFLTTFSREQIFGDKEKGIVRDEFLSELLNTAHDNVINNEYRFKDGKKNKDFHKEDKDLLSTYTNNRVFSEENSTMGTAPSVGIDMDNKIYYNISKHPEDMLDSFELLVKAVMVDVRKGHVDQLQKNIYSPENCSEKTIQAMNKVMTVEERKQTMETVLARFDAYGIHDEKAPTYNKELAEAIADELSDLKGKGVLFDSKKEIIIDDLIDEPLVMEDLHIEDETYKETQPLNPAHASTTVTKRIEDAKIKAAQDTPVILKPSEKKLTDMMESGSYLYEELTKELRKHPNNALSRYRTVKNVGGFEILPIASLNGLGEIITLEDKQKTKTYTGNMMTLAVYQGLLGQTVLEDVEEVGESKINAYKLLTRAAFTNGVHIALGDKKGKVSTTERTAAAKEYLESKLWINGNGKHDTLNPEVIRQIRRIGASMNSSISDDDADEGSEMDYYEELFETGFAIYASKEDITTTLINRRKDLTSHFTALSEKKGKPVGKIRLQVIDMIAARALNEGSQERYVIENKINLDIFKLYKPEKDFLDI